MAKVLYGRSGNKYQLEDKPFASGGEGEVYNIIGQQGSVAKIYKADVFKQNRYISDPRNYMKEKIETMIDQPVDPYMNGSLCIAYPTDALFDSSKTFVGYVMPRIKADKSIITGEREKGRENFFSHYTYRHSVVMSYNMASLVYKLHEAGISLGDFNPQNFMLNGDGTITLVDADSFNIRNKRTGKVYKCKVGVPEMLPPELQGKNLASPNSEFNEYTDCFGLAIHIFVLLMNNRHPFTVVMPQKTRSSVSASKLENNIAEGRCPYTTSSRWKNNTPPGALDVMMLPDYIRSLFDRVFTYDAQNAMSDSIIKNRPSAKEWLQALRRMITEIDAKNEYQVCNVETAHIYRKVYGACPFCACNKRKPIPAPVTSPHPIPSPNINIPKTNLTGPYNAPSVTRRGVAPLWIFSIIFGLITGVILSELFRGWVYKIFDYEVSLTVVQVVMGIVGIAAGIAVSYFLGDYYESISNGILALMLSLLAPVATFVGGIAVLLIIGIIILIVYLVLIIFVLGILAAIAGGG